MGKMDKEDKPQSFPCRHGKQNFVFFTFHFLC